MSEIYMVRHGQASLGAANYDKLSPLGQQQSRFLGEYFRSCELEFDHIFRGDMVRHDETAAGIAAGLGTHFDDVKVMPELNEFDFKALIQAFIQQYPEKALPDDAPVRDFYHLLKQAMHEWSNDRIEGELPERWDEFQARVKFAYQRIQSECTGKVLVVSSGGTNSMLLSQVLKAPAETVVELNLQARNTGVSHFFFNEHAMRLTSFNNTPHLDTPERRGFITFS